MQKQICIPLVFSGSMKASTPADILFECEVEVSYTCFIKCGIRCSDGI